MSTVYSAAETLPGSDPRVAPYLSNPYLLTHSAPLDFIRENWPEIRLYDKQAEILESIVENDETVVPAGNDLGKDFIAALAAIWFFCSRSPVRVVTTSVDGSQLEGVLWGEIRRFINSSVNRLPILYNHLHIRQVMKDGTLEARSEMVGRVVKQGEGLLGRHIEKSKDGRPRTFVIFDESSAIDDICYDTSDTWAHRKLIIGNLYPCENFFMKFTEEGDIPRDSGVGFHRKVIRIRGEDSPNVRLARAEIDAGKPPSNTILIPGVLDYELYVYRRKYWDPKKQSIGLDAQAYKGKEVLLFPIEDLRRGMLLALKLAKEKTRRRAKTMGVDAAEGSDSTVWTVIDEYGIIFQLSLKTKDTADIPGRTIGIMREYNLEPECVFFDRGGGGTQHADQLRRRGYDVRTVGFGEGAGEPNEEKERKTATVRPAIGTRVARAERKYAYKNRRAEMYGLLSEQICSERGFAIPLKYGETIKQLKVIPRDYDEEGRLYIIPKDKKPGTTYKGRTLKGILGRSPDEADSLVLAVYGMLRKPGKVTAGVIS